MGGGGDQKGTVRAIITLENSRYLKQKKRLYAGNMPLIAPPGPAEAMGNNLQARRSITLEIRT